MDDKLRRILKVGRSPACTVVAFRLRGEKHHIQDSGAVFWEHTPALSALKLLLSTQVSSMKINSEYNKCSVAIMSAVNIMGITTVMMLMGNTARKMFKTVVVMVTVVIVVTMLVVAVVVVVVIAVVM